MNNNFYNFSGILIASFIIAFGFSAVLMWLWNAIVVDIFLVPTITYWQAFGLYIISNILFKINTNTGVKLNDKN